MSNFITKNRRWKLTTAILSLSLLTVMAGAAVAPALNLIQDYFSGVNTGLVQMIISLPALFIALTNFFFRPLCKRFKARTLVLIGLALYTAGGCLAGLFSNIFLVLVFRAVVGIGVGIIMPLSTGLISFYFTKDKQAPLMGMSSAMNMMGGVVATLIAGALAMVSWRLAFLVYLMGLISIVLCLVWMPNESIYDPKEQKKERGTFRHYAPFIIGMFLLMFTFFIYPANFALETSRSGVFSQALIAPIMAMMDLLGFAGGLAFSKIRSTLRSLSRFTAPVLFLLAYVFLGVIGGPAGILIGSALVGFANGCGVPYLISTASMKAGRSAATTVMPWLSAALYLAQFTTPMILTAIRSITGTPSLSGYLVAIASSVLFLICSVWAKD